MWISTYQQVNMRSVKWLDAGAKWLLMQLCFFFFGGAKQESVCVHGAYEIFNANFLTLNISSYRSMVFLFSIFSIVATNPTTGCYIKTIITSSILSPLLTDVINSQRFEFCWLHIQELWCCERAKTFIWYVISCQVVEIFLYSLLSIVLCFIIQHACNSLVNLLKLDFIFTKLHKLPDFIEPFAIATVYRCWECLELINHIWDGCR